MNEKKFFIDKNTKFGEKYKTYNYLSFIMNGIAAYLILNPIMLIDEYIILNVIYSIFVLFFVYLPMFVIPATTLYFLDLNLKIRKNKFESFFDKSYLYLCFGFIYICVLAGVVSMENDVSSAILFMTNCLWSVSFHLLFNRYKKNTKDIDTDTKIEKIKKYIS